MENKPVMIRMSKLTEEQKKENARLSQKRYREKHREKRLERTRLWRKTDHGRSVADRSTMDWRKNNPDKVKLYEKKSHRKYNQKIKREVLEHYGNCQCVRCPTNNVACLSLDHVDNDGCAHRKQIKCAAGSKFYLWVKKNGFPNSPRLQVLCMNCQFIKRDEARIRTTKLQIYQHAHRLRLKTLVLSKYGGCRCGACGMTNIICLTLDHVLDNGADHRREIGCRRDIYKYLKKNNFPNNPPLQVLCINCQFLKINKILEETYGYEL